jgi:hypothetical protein
MNPNKMQIQIRNSLAAIVALTALSSPARAAWEFVPDVGLSQERSDNVFLRAVDEQSASRSVLDLRANFSNFNERGNFFIEPRVTADRYAESENENLESDDKYLRAGGQYRWQRSSAAFRTEYSDQILVRSSLTGAIPDNPDVDIPPDVDTGQIAFNPQRRERIFHVGSTSFDLSQQNTLTFELQRLDVSYSGNAAAQQRGSYDYTNFATEFSRDIGPRSEIAFRAFVSDYTAEANSNDSTTSGIEAVFRRSLSEIWSLDFRVGAGESDYSFDDAILGQISRSDSNYLLGLRFRGRAQRNSWNIDFNHSVDPNSSGFLVVRDEAAAFLQHQFTQRLTGRFGARLITLTSLESLASQDRDYTRIEASVEWAMSRAMFLNVGIDSLDQKVIGSASLTTTSTMAFLRFNYRGMSRQRR